MTSEPTTSESAAQAEATYDREVRRHFLRNYLAHIGDSGLYLGGMKFLAPALIMPQLIKSLGGAGWLMAAMPVVGMVGFQLPPLLLAHWVERMERFRPLVILVGILQRLVYIPAALALWFLAADYPLLTLILVAAAPGIKGLIAGVGSTAWQELIACTIPANRRSSLWAWRNILSAGIGFGAGVGVHAVLKRYPGTQGYSILHWITFAFLIGSLCSLLFTREVTHPRQRPTEKIGLIESLAIMPGLLKADRRLQRFLVAIMFAAGVRIMLPFLTPHILGVLHKGESYMGVVVIASMVGNVLGNIAAGFIGDRVGGKAVMVVNWAGMLGMCLWLLLARTAGEFWVILALHGATSACFLIGVQTLAVELGPVEKRVRYLSLTAAASMISSLAVWGISSLCFHLSGGSFRWLTSLAIACLIGAGVAMVGIREPRGETTV